MYQIYVQHRSAFRNNNLSHFSKGARNFVFVEFKNITLQGALRNSLLQLILTESDCALLFMLKLYKLFKNTLIDAK